MTTRSRIQWVIPLLWLGHAVFPTLLSAQSSGAQVQVRASVSETTIGIEEVVVYMLEVEGAGFNEVQPPQPPIAEALALTQPLPETRRSVPLVNGEIRPTIAYRWTYRPLREGSARILPTTVVVKGREYETQEIGVRVVAQARRDTAPPAQSLDPLGNRPSDPAASEAPVRVDPSDVFLRAVTSARTVWQGEQVTVEYRLFYRQGVHVRDARSSGTSWDANGFWREDLAVTGPSAPAPVLENGAPYNMIPVKRAALFPTRAGTLRVDPLQLEIEAMIPRLGNYFGSFFLRDRYYSTVTVASAPLAFSVRALPEGAPDGFNGAVGQFTFQAQLSREAVEAGEALELTLRVAGRGNLSTLEAPVLDVPSAFERYDPQTESQIDHAGDRISGHKTFRYVLVPRVGGTYTLPPVAFAWFDPERGRYQTARSTGWTVRVTNAANTTAPATLPIDDIAGLLREPSPWVSTHPTPLHQQGWFYLLLLLPLAGLVALYLYQRRADYRAAHPLLARSQQATPLARRYLKQAETVLARHEGTSGLEARLFYEALERAVLGFVAYRLNLPERGLTRPQLDTRLAAAGLTPDLRLALGDLLDECDVVRFAPIRPDTATLHAALERAALLITTLDQQTGPTVSA